MPCTAPPSTWPRTIVGLTTRPMSLTDAVGDDARRRRCPGSISTSQTWQAFGQRRRRRRCSSESTMDARVGLLAGELEQVDAEIGADDRKRPARYSMSAARRLERLGGERLRVLDGALGSDLHRRAAGEERARAGAAEAVAAIGVALDDADLLDRHAEDVDRELRVAGLRCPAPSAASPRRSR